ncbi:MAG: hypothetical protein OEM49_06505 [Myxococcales bacterium]|nr:hypothetical protein [Myxococcales bacterium]MDH5307980.1 hypothetical protein [Myxococcales bacterium]MDH5566363.1 hypothetical protein [Myxococcales bacterium]
MSWTTLRCARCGGRGRKQAYWGYPDPEILEKAARGELPDVVFGGCVLGEPFPTWLCDACEDFFGDDTTARQHFRDELDARRRAAEAASRADDPHTAARRPERGRGMRALLGVIVVLAMALGLLLLSILVAERVGASHCGIPPIEPVPPPGCRDLCPCCTAPLLGEARGPGTLRA